MWGMWETILMSIDNIRMLELELYKLKDKLNSYEIDMGPNGSCYPMRKEVATIDEMIKFLERYNQ
jgi:hypothetical protein